MGTAVMTDTTQRRLVAELAATPDQIREAQHLRYRVFAEEMGAKLESMDDGYDWDRFDAFCSHLLVRDVERDEIIACTRILLEEQAEQAGGFYSNSEFDLSNILQLPGRLIELGRTCVAPNYRSGPTIAVLWGGLADFVATHKVDYMIGCVSVSIEDGGAQANAVMDRLRRKNMVAPELRVEPRHPLPRNRGKQSADLKMPPLVKAYIALGAKACGEPCLDPDFQVADIFMLLDVRDLAPRYAKHFLSRRTDPVTGALRACA